MILTNNALESHGEGLSNALSEGCVEVDREQRKVAKFLHFPSLGDTTVRFEFVRLRHMAASTPASHVV